GDGDDGEMMTRVVLTRWLSWWRWGSRGDDGAAGGDEDDGGSGGVAGVTSVAAGLCHDGCDDDVLRGG
ncbi:hypothetical protein Tco_0483180, partial [Tanacetum coccineum]